MRPIEFASARSAMENCPFEPRLSAFYDREMSAEDARRLEDHLPSCATCSNELRSMKIVTRLMTAPTDGRLSQFGLARLHQVADQAAEANRSPSILRPLLAIAASVLIIAGAWLVELPGQTTHRSASTTHHQEEWERLASGGKVEFYEAAAKTEVVQNEQFQRYMLDGLK